MIAHRPSAVQNADAILVMDEGRTVEAGSRPTRAILLHISVLFAALTFTTFSAAESNFPEVRPLAEYSDDQLVDFYIHLTFNLEGGYDGRELQSLAKWSSQESVKVYTFPRNSIFDGQDPNRYRELIDLVELVATEISSPIDNLSIQALDSEELEALAASGELSNPSAYQNSITILIGDKSEIREGVFKISPGLPEITEIYERHLSGAESVDSPLCFGVAVSQPTQPPHLFRAWVFIEDTSKSEVCIYEELMQTFGVFNDFPPETPSIFNDDNMFDRPTELDWLMWKIHFDPRLLPGMNQNDVRKIVPQIISEIRP